MTWRVPAELEQVVLAATTAVLGAAPLTTPMLTRAIVDRSRRYTSERDRLAAPADRRADLAARAAFFTIADAMKIAVPLAELAGRGALPAGQPLRVVDVGAGCGAMSLGLLASLAPGAPGGATVEIVAIDRDADALRIAGQAARALAAHHGLRVAVSTRAEDVASAVIPACDLVVIGSVLNELSPAACDALVHRALAAIGPDGAVIVIEPALRETSRALHALRDAVLSTRRAHVFAPCVRGVAPCPALANPDDWCHEDRDIELPPRTAELARLTHLRDHGMKFSYLVLRRADTSLVASPRAWRVVSQPRPAKGKLELFGCGDAGRVPLRLLSRNRSEANREFQRARRGDVVIVAEEVADGRVEIGPDLAVEIVEPAGR